MRGHHVIASSVARGESAAIEGAAHWCMLEQSDAVNEVLFGFLERAAP